MSGLEPEGLHMSVVDRLVVVVVVVHGTWPVLSVVVLELLEAGLALVLMCVDDRLVDIGERM